MRSLRVAALGAVAALALAACSSSPDARPTASSGTLDPVTASAAPALTGTLTVFAAASLQGTFTTIGNDLMAAHPGLKVRFSFGSSGTLTQQLLAGAPADVFASANTKTMSDAASVVGGTTVFAHNSLVIVVPKGNPAGVTGLADFAKPALKIALCDPSAPCGSAAQAVFAKAGLTAAPDTLGQDVKATLAYVTSGEADAALVYRTDAIAAGPAVQTIAFPEADAVVNAYPIALVKGTTNPAAAQAFVADVLSPAGQKVLAAAGFDPAG
ncbi:MAG TPA: molybdate ABC transporter substrate-binding protein [Propionicimonas sp.]